MAKMVGWIGRAAVRVAAAAALGACAASPSPNRPGRVTEATVREGSYTMEMRLNRSDVQIIDTLRFDGERAWAELPAVYQALGLPLSAVDARARRLAVNGFQPRRIEGEPLSRYLDCGRGVTAGEYADSYEVYLSVETQLVATPGDPGRGTIQSLVSANARPRAVSGNPLACQSLGRLERRIRELLQERLAAAGGG